MNAIDAASLGIKIATGGSERAEASSSANGAGAGGVFGDVFHSATQEVNKLDTDAQSAVVGLMNGQGVEVHDAMIATQRSELAFELALQVRNKAISAYQQMMQMQF